MARVLAGDLAGRLSDALAGAIFDEPGVRPAWSGAPEARWVVAFSGGLDSTVLLHLAVRVLGPRNVVAAHVHHGLQPAADIWPAHCEARAREAGADFECVRLEGSPGRGQSLEAWARDARYAALASVALRAGCIAVLTAHHADDQVETVLMRLARGTGIDGLVGIEPSATLGGVTVLRPLLALRRTQLAAYARRHALRSIEDPSNADRRRPRNAIRHRVLPAIDAALPGFREHLLDALPHVRAARDAQAALAAQDLESARVDAGLDRRVLAGLSPERRNAALRGWLRAQGLRAPSEARLREMTRQLVEARGADGRVVHDGVAILRHRDTIGTCDPSALDVGPPAAIELTWRGEDCLDLPAATGRLRFVSVEPGAAHAVSEAWLAEQTLLVTAGGATSERMRPQPRARLRTLKNLYQERGVPAWARATLPLVYARGQLLYASGIGMDCEASRPRAGACVSLHWEPAATDDPRWAWCSRAPLG